MTTGVESRRRAQLLLDVNTARARAAAAVEAQWIADLGDLSTYGLSPRVRRAAELRRDNPRLSYPQLAGTMGISKHAYTGLIRQLRNKVIPRARSSAPVEPPTLAAIRRAKERADGVVEAEWIANFGDLSGWALPPSVRRAAELRRDNPQLSYPQVAELMGVPVNVFMNSLNRFRASANRPTLAQRIAGLGDLATLKLPPRLRQAAELRRDHPDLTQPQLADLMGIPRGTYKWLLERFEAAVSWPDSSDQDAVAAASDSATARRAAGFDARQIAALGDLSVYDLSEGVRRAAELRRDHPQMTYAQLGACMGITAGAYAGLLRRFWSRRPKASRASARAQWIAELGDLAAYPLSDRVRRAAELRRDHPEMTTAQLADLMSINRNSYKLLLRRFRGIVTGELDSLRKPPLPRRFGDLIETVRRIETAELDYQLAAR